jgi:SAM-dependent methyltransferase
MSLTQKDDFGAMAGIKAVPLDYDQDPERFRANVRAVEKYGLGGDVHELAAERLAAEKCGLVLDLGCGEGRFLRPARARGLAAVGFDYSATMLGAAGGLRVQGDACRLPFADGCFGAAAALYMLYHLAEPRQAIAECYRVLRRGGFFAACAPSRDNDPELAEVLPASDQTFDAENGLALIGAYFQVVEVERWDAPLVHLPDRAALALYLRGRQLEPDQVQAALSRLRTPLTLTKRGALFVGRKEE